MFYESNFLRLVATCLTEYILHLHTYFSSVDQTHKYKNKSFPWAAYGDKHVTNMCYWKTFLQSWEGVVFILITVGVSFIFSYLTVCFFGRMMAHFYINVFINARDKSCKVGWAPYGVHLISNNADRAPSGHWPMLSYTDGDRWPNDMNASENSYLSSGVRAIINSPVMCKSLKSYDVSFICDHSIKSEAYCQLTVRGRLNQAGRNPYYLPAVEIKNNEPFRKIAS